MFSRSDTIPGGMATLSGLMFLWYSLFSTAVISSLCGMFKYRDLTSIVELSGIVVDSSMLIMCPLSLTYDLMSGTIGCKCSPPVVIFFQLGLHSR